MQKKPIWMGLLCLLLAASLPVLAAQPSATPQIDPPYDFDPAAMQARDFGPYFEKEYPTTRETYLLLAGTPWQNEVTVLKGTQEGPAIYIVAGVHGGEIAAWMSANLIKKASIQKGTLYILSPANPWGAASTPRSRYVREKQDLNRSFPGDGQGNEAQQVANAIFADIKRIAPAFVFDLHEAFVNEENRDFLGNSLIYTTLDGMEDLYLDLLMESEAGTLTSTPFNFFSPGPKGSVNHTINTMLKIPVITVETYRGSPLQVRIGDQLAVVQRVLEAHGLL